MKSALLLAIAIVTLSSLPVASRSSNAEAQEAAGARTNESASASAHAGNAQANGSASSSTAAEMRPVNAELVGKLDAKSARAGDTVVAKTREKVRTADGTEIPKGTRLVGHVTDVQAHGAGHRDSHMSIAFDRAELKGGQSIAIHSVLQSIAPPASAAAAMDSDDAFSAPMGGGSMAAGSMGGAMQGGHSGSGLVGGAVGATGGVTSSVAPSAGGIGRSTSDLAGNATMAAGEGVSNLHGAAAATESLGAHATSVPGVMLSGDATGSASGTLSAADRNVHLDSGSQLVLGVATAGPR